jgi:sugar lactone lactonase YvrE
MYESGNLQAMQITPDGKDVVAASGYPDVQAFRVSDLSPDGDYPAAAFADSLSIADDGTVATDTYDGSYKVLLFAPGGSSTPLYSYDFGDSSVVTNGVAITPDGNDLFAITSPNGPHGDNPTLNIITNPVQGPSTLSVTGPATDNKDGAITLTGTLGGASPYAGGQILQVTRVDPTNPDGVALPDVTTAADGSFTITDTPPKANVDTGTVTYQVSYAGDDYLAEAAPASQMAPVSSPLRWAVRAAADCSGVIRVPSA